MYLQCKPVNIKLMVEFLHKFWHVPFIWFAHLVKGPFVAGLGILLSLIGLIFVSLRQGAFWVMAVGVPLISAGVSFIFYGVYDLIFGIFSPRHQFIDCPFCQTQLKFSPKVKITTCKNCGNRVKIKRALN